MDYWVSQESLYNPYRSYDYLENSRKHIIILLKVKGHICNRDFKIKVIPSFSYFNIALLLQKFF